MVYSSLDLGSHTDWVYWISRIGHDVVSFWSILFGIWVIQDAYRTASK